MRPPRTSERPATGQVTRSAKRTYVLKGLHCRIFAESINAHCVAMMREIQRLRVGRVEA